jgi:hypothetical protein
MGTTFAWGIWLLLIAWWISTANAARDKAVFGAIIRREMPDVIPRKLLVISKTCDTAVYMDAWRDQGWTVTCLGGDHIKELVQVFPDRAQLISKLLPIQRADLLRYAWLHKYGGGYADDDVEPYPSAMENFQTYEHAHLIVGYERFEPNQGRLCGSPKDMLCESLSQWQFFSRAGNPILKSIIGSVLDRLEKFDRSKQVNTMAEIRANVINVTGPSTFTDGVFNSSFTQSSSALSSQSEARIQSVNAGELLQTFLHEKLAHLIQQGLKPSSSREANGTIVLGIAAFGCGQDHSASPPCSKANPSIWSKHHFSGSWLK